MADPYLGQIMLAGFDFAPKGWAQCNGQILPIAQNSALFSLLGIMYGGDGVVTFGLPDLRGRVPQHLGQGPGLSPFIQGERFGTETVELFFSDLPRHTHTVACDSTGANQQSPAGHLLATETTGVTAPYSTLPENYMNPMTVSPVGGNQAHNNMQPYITINFCIALSGIFPSHA